MYVCFGWPGSGFERGGRYLRTPNTSVERQYGLRTVSTRKPGKTGLGNRISVLTDGRAAKGADVTLVVGRESSVSRRRQVDSIDEENGTVAASDLSFSRRKGTNDLDGRQDQP